MLQKSLTYGDFVNKELILFSLADNQRSIPSMVDGLKPGQRKILYGCFKRRCEKRRGASGSTRDDERRQDSSFETGTSHHHLLYQQQFG